jgi:hypothetical protein
MSLPSILLRLVLCVALVANGIGTAVAGMRMHAGAAQVQAQAAEPCHATSLPAPVAKAATTHAHEHAGDCCHAGACTCQCLQQAHLAFAAGLALLPQSRHDAVVHVSTATREPPRLPHLIRPPIAPAC